MCLFGIETSLSSVLRAEGSQVLLSSFGVYPAIEQSTNLLISWILVGHGEKSYEDCGSVVGTKACPNHKKDYVLLHKRCFRPECPVCFPAWVSREAESSSERLKGVSGVYGNLGGCKHFIVSPPQDLALKMLGRVDDYRALKSMCIDLLELKRLPKWWFMDCDYRDLVGFHGCIVFHPFRQDGLIWYLSPHFHVVGYGRLPPGNVFYEWSGGWVYKNAGYRKTIFGSISYELSHAGLGFVEGKRLFHCLTWFGKFSYNKAVIEEEVKEVVYEDCKVCGEHLHKYVPAEFGSDYYVDGVWDYKNFNSWVDCGFYAKDVVRRVYRLKS